MPISSVSNGRRVLYNSLLLQARSSAVQRVDEIQSELVAMIKSLLPLAVPAAQPEQLTETLVQDIKSVHGETAVDASASTVSADAVAIVTGAVATSAPAGAAALDEEGEIPLSVELHSLREKARASKLHMATVKAQQVQPTLPGVELLLSRDPATETARQAARSTLMSALFSAASGVTSSAASAAPSLLASVVAEGQPDGTLQSVALQPSSPASAVAGHVPKPGLVHPKAVSQLQAAPSVASAADTLTTALLRSASSARSTSAALAPPNLLPDAAVPPSASAASTSRTRGVNVLAALQLVRRLVPDALSLVSGSSTISSRALGSMQQAAQSLGPARISQATARQSSAFTSEESSVSASLSGIGTSAVNSPCVPSSSLGAGSVAHTLLAASWLPHTTLMSTSCSREIQPLINTASNWEVSFRLPGEFSAPSLAPAKDVTARKVVPAATSSIVGGSIVNVVAASAAAPLAPIPHPADAISAVLWGNDSQAASLDSADAAAFSRQLLEKKALHAEAATAGQADMLAAPLEALLAQQAADVSAQKANVATAQEQVRLLDEHLLRSGAIIAASEQRMLQITASAAAYGGISEQVLGRRTPTVKRKMTTRASAAEVEAAAPSPISPANPGKRKRRDAAVHPDPRKA